MSEYDSYGFKEAFKRYRREMGKGKVFTWRGKRYTTDYKEEVAKKPKEEVVKKTEYTPKSTKVTSKSLPEMNPEYANNVQYRIDVGDKFSDDELRQMRPFDKITYYDNTGYMPSHETGDFEKDMQGLQRELAVFGTTNDPARMDFVRQMYPNAFEEVQRQNTLAKVNLLNQLQFEAGDAPNPYYQEVLDNAAYNANIKYGAENVDAMYKAIGNIPTGAGAYTSPDTRASYYPGMMSAETANLNPITTAFHEEMHNKLQGKDSYIAEEDAVRRITNDFAKKMNLYQGENPVPPSGREINTVAERLMQLNETEPGLANDPINMYAGRVRKPEYSQEGTAGVWSNLLKLLGYTK